LNFAAFAESVRVGDFEVEEFGTGAYLDVSITNYTGPGGGLVIERQIPGRAVTIIGQNVFAGKNITSVKIPGTVTEIREGAFRDNLLGTVELPESLAAIGESAFSGNNLQEIVLPPYIHTVGDRAFAGNRITRITVGEDVNVEEEAFDQKFAAFYVSAGKNAGVYVYKAGRWYRETDWIELSESRDAAAANAAPAAHAGAQNASGAYRIGSAGPAGGIIFYDKGNSSGGWRYLEAAPEDMESQIMWGSMAGSGRYLPRLSQFRPGVGEGRQNTERNQYTTSAADACKNYTAGGYADWFLPSKDELDLMYRNLKQKGLGNFKDGWYWSSTGSGNTTSAWNQNFANGRQYGYDEIRRTNRVRAARAF
jgi:hypothetical protein